MISSLILFLFLWALPGFSQNNNSTDGASTQIAVKDSAVADSLSKRARDLLEILATWGACPLSPLPCPADLDEMGSVDFADILILLGNWGYCPGVPGAAPPSLEDELACMGLSQQHWDDFQDCMTTGTPAEQDNCACWMDHYYDCHCVGICLGLPNCSGADPFATHPH